MFDGLGSERTVTNSSQTVTGTITFEGFGATIATTGSSSNPYKFAATSGYRDDGDAGLFHVGARYYDAQVGRFVTRDTELDQHAYLYCEHDPVNNLDPSGHNILAELVGSVKGIVGGVGVVAAIGGVIEDHTPEHTIAHGVGGTLAGGGTSIVGIAIFVAASSPALPAVIIVGGAVLGTGLILGGIWHAIHSW